MTDSDQCPRCGAVESREHLLIECPQIKAMWEKMLRACGSMERPTWESILGINDKLPLLKIKAEIIGILLRKDRADIQDILPIRMAIARLKVDHSKSLKRAIARLNNNLGITV